MLLAIVLPVILGLIGVYLLLPRIRPYPTIWGAAASGLALLLGGFTLIRGGMAVPENLLFYCFSAIAIVTGQQAGIAEPKPMEVNGAGHGCGHNLLGAGAMLAARVKRLVYGARDPKGGADGGAFGSGQCSAHASVTSPPGCRRAME